MDVTGVVIIGVLSTLVVLIGVELVAPARRFEEVRGWRAKCLVFVVLVLAIAGSIPFVLADVIDDVKLVSGDRLGIAGGAVVGIIVSELLVYWAHRLHHTVPFLWRWVHQLHHSAERVDVFGAAYFHPFEIIEGTVVGVVLFNVVLGLSPEAAVIAGAWQPFNALFQHGNFKTPVWIGYLIQRPEAHGVHHERGVHGFNYANLPLWDLVFGTFKNPREWDAVAGFYPGASRRTWEMLIGRDISREAPR
ncbi:MAG TPA: sterol desaturase family protein [Kofleriaceae bacterium]|jgi:sterol desaturase/sphingolipid hydroxylase (fatty acid hydroxylase superfamily)|nr:sterol desaturase family protein [Kofleriaceae bacterium]